MVLMRFVTAAALAAFVFAHAGPAFAEDPVVRGEKLYGLCQQCHGQEGAGDPLSLAPAIAGFQAWYVERQVSNFKHGLRGLHPDDKGGLRMYPMSLALKSDEDIAAVAAYVASLPRAKPPRTVEGDPAKGETSYKTCAACHGPDGNGNQALNAPSLIGSSDWYLVETLHKYKAGVRGGNTDNQNSVMMRGMALSLADDQAIRDVVAYIMTLRD
jgi:cytochrome c oxidase subunit 2